MKYLTLAIYLIVAVIDFIILHRAFIYDIILEFSDGNEKIRRKYESPKYRIPLQVVLAAIWPIRFIFYAISLILG